MERRKERKKVRCMAHKFLGNKSWMELGTSEQGWSCRIADSLSKDSRAMGAQLLDSKWDYECKKKAQVRLRAWSQCWAEGLAPLEKGSVKWERTLMVPYHHQLYQATRQIYHIPVSLRNKSSKHQWGGVPGDGNWKEGERKYRLKKILLIYVKFPKSTMKKIYKWWLRKSTIRMSIRLRRN